MLSSLPNEILTEIFSSLDYFTLTQSVRRVCRKFACVIDSALGGELAENLFQDQAKLSVLDPPNIEEFEVGGFDLHPVFDVLQIRRSSHASGMEEGNLISSWQLPIGTQNLGFHNSRGSFTPLKRHPVATENAVSPARDYVEFDFRIMGGWSFHGCVDNRASGEAVSVYQLVEAMDSVFGVAGSKLNNWLLIFIFKKGEPMFSSEECVIRKGTVKQSYDDKRTGSWYRVSFEISGWDQLDLKNVGKGSSRGSKRHR